MKRLFYILATCLTLLIFGKTTVENVWKLQTSITYEMDLIYSYLIKQNKEPFKSKVISISEKLQINPNWLMGVMFLESTLNHRAQNTRTGATGLIQFMPVTANKMGVTIPALINMTNVEQLDYVYQYLKPYRGKMKSFVDVYLAVFFPAAIGKEPDFILQSRNLSAALIASQNSAYDLDRDQDISKKELETALLLRLKPEYLTQLQ